MDTGNNAPPLTVSLLALPESAPATLYCLLEVFAAVGITWRELTGEAYDVRRVQAEIVAGEPAPLVSPLGVSIVPQRTIDEIAETDIVIVTDLAFPLDVASQERWRGRWPREADWIAGQFERGATVCSVCTGSLFLAEAGLLDDREATTHWSAVDLFRTHYPRARLHAERILCPTGPEHRIVTSGGASSWEELALYLIARFCGTAEAVRIAKTFILGDRSEGQLPFAAMGRPRRHDDAVVADCQSWIAEHYATASPVTRLAQRSGLPERTFKRRFRAATGYAPVDYVQALRIEEAKQMLETTDELTDSITRTVGYEDPAFFRRLFKRLTGVTPARYRQRFRGIGRLAPSPD